MSLYYFKLRNLFAVVGEKTPRSQFIQVPENTLQILDLFESGKRFTGMDSQKNSGNCGFVGLLRILGYIPAHRSYNCGSLQRCETPVGVSQTLDTNTVLVGHEQQRWVDLFPWL